MLGTDLAAHQLVLHVGLDRVLTSEPALAITTLKVLADVKRRCSECSSVLSLSCRFLAGSRHRRLYEGLYSKSRVNLVSLKNLELIALDCSVARAIVSLLQQKWRFHLDFQNKSKTKSKNTEHETASERSRSLSL